MPAKSFADHCIHIYVSPEVKKIIKAIAKQADKSVSRWVMDKAMEDAAKNAIEAIAKVRESSHEKTQ